MEMPIFIQNESLAELATDFPGAIDVLKKYDLDYCCGGRLTLEEACQQKNLPYQKVLKEVMDAKPSVAGHSLRFQDWSTTFLTEFIVQNYHRYVRESMPMIRELLEKVCAVHGLKHPALHLVSKQFADLDHELTDHMEKEELVLFPALTKMELLKGRGSDPLLQHIDKPIAVLLEEHQMAGDLLKAIRLNTNMYTPPADACPTFILLYDKLKEFDDELINHIHLENNILFKRIES